MHKEAKCVSELCDLLSQVRIMLLVNKVAAYFDYWFEVCQYVDETNTDSSSGIKVGVDEDSDKSIDIETDIREEIKAMQEAQTKALFQPIDVDLKCGKCRILSWARRLTCRPSHFLQNPVACWSSSFGS